MDVIRNLFPGIVSVEYFDSSLLAEERPDLAAMAGADISVPEQRFNIPLIEPGTCEVTAKDGAEFLSLKFSAQKRINPRFRPAFLFKDANQRCFLVASKSKPFPKVEIVRSFGSVPDARPEFSYQISHTAMHTPIEILL